MPVHIAIVSHKYAGLSGSSYVIKHISDVWREKGFCVSFVQNPTAQLEADLAVLHVDLSVIPDEYLNFIYRFPVVINGSVRDISKRTISSHIIEHSSRFTGAVIVKTNLNCGGIPEMDLRVKTSPLFRLIHPVRRRFPWSLRSCLNTMDYRVFESVDQVPWPVWHNPNLIVEKFIPEMNNGLYCLRTWLFLGDKETNSICYSEEPVIKSANIIRREVTSEIPDELRQLRKDLDFDYGKFDYAIADGRVVLYDANRTPTFGNFNKEKFSSTVHLLAEGINDFL